MGQSPPGSSCNQHEEGLPLLGGPADLGAVYPDPKQWTTSPTKTSQKGDIFVCVRATIGEPRWSDGEYCVGRGLSAIRPKSTDVSAHYLFHVIEGQQEKLHRQGTGTTFKTISKRHLEALEVPLLATQDQRYVGMFLDWLAKHGEKIVDWSSAPPLPNKFSGQRRIIEKIERMASKIEEANRLRNNLREATDGFFVSCRADSIKECLSKGKIPIADAVLFERGKFSHRPRNDPRFFGGDHPWIQIGEIEASNKYITAWNTTLNDEGLAISRKFPKGTVLISIAATIGAVGILGFDCCIPDSIVAATPKPGVESEFVYHYLGFLRTHLEEVAPQSAQKNINLRILSALPFPSIPESKQREIVGCLDGLQAKIDQMKTLQTKTAAELDAMLPSILDRAFRGEL